MEFVIQELKKLFQEDMETQKTCQENEHKDKNEKNDEVLNTYYDLCIYNTYGLVD